MLQAGELNHVHGLYRSGCCGIERTLADNCKFPPVQALPIQARIPAQGRTPPGAWCGRRR